MTTHLICILHHDRPDRHADILAISRWPLLHFAGLHTNSSFHCTHHARHEVFAARPDGLEAALCGVHVDLTDKGAECETSTLTL